ncbi:MAG: hypothetical protein AVDCRST_MAG02-2484 [uncultured Rubrobacteraceae bacterium]|uniref:Uncharacterized protein n=1 Tax=uncultured Rubrobacteraceae bacterium TaxID=349277 RepID=A0A6J4R8I0_9ACTN|nr:MAG: hypothetical protein AVDCRST_MAG02-2484 [uncultured Rubrobacteraceae bacterium]
MHRVVTSLGVGAIPQGRRERMLGMKVVVGAGGAGPRRGD